MFPTNYQGELGQRAWMKTLIIMCVAWLLLALSCFTDVVTEPQVVPISPTTTPIPLPGSSLRERARNDVVNDAVRLATAGCPGVNERLSGLPTRILAPPTNSGTTGGLMVMNHSIFDEVEHGPEGLGGVNVWVVAVEGPSSPINDNDYDGGASVRSFVFVTRIAAHELTECVVREAPMPSRYANRSCPNCGGFKFETLYEQQP